jgi:hypothetical protein
VALLRFDAGVTIVGWLGWISWEVPVQMHVQSDAEVRRESGQMAQRAHQSTWCAGKFP